MADEKRLIDANALKEAMWNADCDVYEFCQGEVTKMGISRLKLDDLIDDCPTVDAVEVPCKIGDSLWCVYSPPYPANPADKGKWYMGEFEVARFHYGAKGLSIEMYGFGTVAWKEIGKTAFLSRKEAEAALAKMDGGIEDG